jgi:hypothetical protein
LMINQPWVGRSRMNEPKPMGKPFDIDKGVVWEAYRRVAVNRLLAVSSGFGDQVDVVPAWRVDGGVIVSLAA